MISAMSNKLSTLLLICMISIGTPKCVTNRLDYTSFFHCIIQVLLGLLLSSYSLQVLIECEIIVMAQRNFVCISGVIQQKFVALYLSSSHCSLRMSCLKYHATCRSRFSLIISVDRDFPSVLTNMICHGQRNFVCISGVIQEKCRPLFVIFDIARERCLV